MLQALIGVTAFHAVVALASVLIPGPMVTGFVLHFCLFLTPSYVRGRNGQPLLYRLNGVSVLLFIVGLYAYHGYKEILSPLVWYDNYWSIVSASFIIGLAASFYFYVRGIFFFFHLL
jgi:hypothetical protein